ncbi:glycoside hydrolase family 2 TIM barrel-domain containing protein [Parablautia muri]|uniref:Glycoside hydrolase family 2 protein n=1 Tax=Parablautia muri TaxID=2320879 RepID=A0A9X5GTX0_9FIRM|nr:glycoside hydrolase family 2 TIM barrel-domain containing protein [Parablautia muri]NBJ94451.1 glycoside hydrolase family 2 protein [Parablautia muri]
MKKIKFNHNWVFHEGGGSSLEALLGGEAVTKEITLPHDASVEKERNPQEPGGSGNGFFREETIHYTKEFTLEADCRDKNIWLEFEGVYQNAFVYINNSYAGKCPYGYGNFYIDATKYVQFDKKNTIKVIVKNGVPSGRWYTGGGIYRDVNLMIGDRMHLAADGAHLAAVDVEEGQAAIRVESTIEYTGTGTRDIILCAQLVDGEGKVVAQDHMPVTIQEHSKETYRQRIYVENPRLWDVDSPYLYCYRISLMEADEVLDEEEGTFGIRKLQLDTKYGLRINGKVVNLRGGCIHHDNGVTGTAEFPHAAWFRVKKLKEAGYNAIRSSHYPMSRRLLEACDRIGMLVMDEFADVWTSTKVDFDYGTHMAQWWEHDVTNLVNKDYNHPCVIMYSIGNEIPETGNKFDVQWGKKLADKIRSLDDSRYVTNSLNLMLSIMDRMGDMMASAQAGAPGADAGQGTDAGENAEINSMMSNMGDMMDKLVSSEIAGKATEEAFAQVDIAGYNYATCRYLPDKETYPNRIIVGSETYPKDLDVNWELIEKYPHLIGDFSWTAWDYLGEAGIGKINYGGTQGFSFYAPYPQKAAYCGDMNLIGDRRPISYWREIIWGLRKAPYIAVQLPEHHGDVHNMTNWSMTDAVRSWNWKGYEGKPVTVEVYTDAEEVELSVNGKVVEKKKVGKIKKYMAFFETVYEPGTIEAVAFSEGRETGRDVIVSAKEQVKIAAVSDMAQIPADASDICYVEVSMVDEEGNLNPGADKVVTVSIDGPGVVLGYGSADPASVENYFDKTAKAYEGRLRAAIRGNGQKGTITVTFTGDGCKEAKVRIEAV